MTNTNTATKLHRFVAIAFAAAAMLALGAIDHDAAAAPGHRVSQCTENLRDARATYRTEDARIQRLTELRVFRHDRAATRRVHRIATNARTNAANILARRPGVRAANHCRIRVRKFRAAARELRAGIQNINTIRTRQLRRARNTRGSVNRTRPVRNTRTTTTVTRDRRRR